MNLQSVKLLIQEAGRPALLEPHERCVSDMETLLRFVEALRSVGNTIVLTQGTFDLIHVGHARYVKKAKEQGDILIVGVDDDKKARGRKGENRPVVPLEERMEMLANIRAVDLVAIKYDSDPRWHMIKSVEPDVLVAVEGTYTPEELKELEQYCKKLVVLSRQAETSTSAQVRKNVLDGAERFSVALTRVLVEGVPKMVAETYDRMKEGEIK